MAAVLVHGRAGGAPAPAKSPAKSRAATKVRTAASPARSHSRLRACSACKFLAGHGPCSLSQLTIFIASLTGHVASVRRQIRGAMGRFIDHVRH